MGVFLISFLLFQIQQATARLDGQLPETRQLRTCGICFDLTVGLLRVLEMVCSIVPEVFTDRSRSSAELTLTRLFQVSEKRLVDFNKSGLKKSDHKKSVEINHSPKKTIEIGFENFGWK